MKSRIMLLPAIAVLLLSACASGDSSSMSIESSSGAADAQAVNPTASTSATPQASESASPTSSKVLYLTFDDGPAASGTGEILKLLDKYDAKAVFFVYGEMAVQRKKQLKEIVAHGQTIGNHTWHHDNLADMSEAQIVEELDSVADLVGDDMAACVRPPYLGVDDQVFAVARKHGYKVVMGDLGSNDWANPPTDELVANLKSITKNGNNIIMHDGPEDRASTIAALKVMLPWWQDKGYTFETLPNCTQPLSEKQ
ncbi:MAG: polysaccharide deacetylase family protein [Actinobacteria bacterium]|nr:polysaccharide deacetylase family protein [Actinomycetota bacterium]